MSPTGKIFSRLKDGLRRQYKRGSFWGKVGMVIVMFSTILPVWWQNEKMEKRAALLQGEVDSLRKEARFYRKELEMLRNDPTYVEFLLRTKLHYGYKGEHVWGKFPDLDTKFPQRSSEK